MYKLTIEEYAGGWFWELRSGKKKIAIPNYGYSTKSNARRAFWRLLGIKPSNIVEE